MTALWQPKVSTVTWHIQDIIEHKDLLFGTLGSPVVPLVGRAAWSASIIAAAARTSASTASIAVVISRGTAWGVSLFWFHLTRGYDSKTSYVRLSKETEVFISKLTLSISLCKLDLDLTSTHPFSVQIVQSVLCVTDIFEHAVLLRFLVITTFIDWTRNLQTFKDSSH